MERCGIRSSGASSDGSSNLGTGVSAGVVLFRPDLPPPKFEPQLSGARLRSRISNRRDNPLGLRSQARDRQIRRGWTDIDNFDVKPGARRGVTAIVPPGLLQVGNDDQSPARVLRQFGALVEKRGIPGTPVCGLHAAERGTRRRSGPRLGDDVGSIVECDDRDTLTWPGLVNGGARTFQRV